MTETEQGENAPGARRRIVFLNRRAPHGTIYAIEALEVVLISAAFDQAVTVLFLDDGVWQLMRGQDTSGIGVKDFSPTFRVLEEYGVERIAVDRASLGRRGLGPGDLSIPIEVIDTAEAAAILDGADAVLSF